MVPLPSDQDLLVLSQTLWLESVNRCESWRARGHRDVYDMIAYSKSLNRAALLRSATSSVMSVRTGHNDRELTLTISIQQGGEG